MNYYDDYEPYYDDFYQSHAPEYEDECEECNAPSFGRLCDDCKLDSYDEVNFRDELTFADPGGVSALRAETLTNPRNLPCPTCREPNRLTPADSARGYQCDRCASAAEFGN